MKIPETFLPEKKLDNKIEELLKEKPLKKPQISKDEIPSYAIQENGDYLIARGGIIFNMPDHKSINNTTFYFTIDGEEHKLHRGTKEVNWLDGKHVTLEEDLVCALFEFGLTAFEEPDVDVPSYHDFWKAKMKHKTEEVYKELSNAIKNGGIKPIVY